MPNMHLCRRFADEQSSADLLIGQTLNYQTENFLFAVGQWCAAWALCS
jgi:hypothetical protein